MSIAQLFDEINSKSKAVKNSELHNLYKRPQHENRTDTPVTQIFAPNMYQQADLLFMPEDKGFKYILVITDVHSHKVDCVGLKNKDSEGIIKAFKAVYRRGILKKPFVIQFDAGSEFKNHEVRAYFHSIKVNCKYALTGRHRQQAMVERMNQKIGTILFKRMTSQELLTGEVSRDWVDDLKPLVKVLNSHRPPAISKPLYEDPIFTDYSKNIIPIGKKVRVLLDHPINAYTEKRLSGTFRSTDTRWSPETRTVEQVLLKPGFPPMYLVSGDMVARTKQQLQIVRRNEKEPNPKYIRGTPEHYKINEILDHKTVNHVKKLLIRYKGYPIPSWENETAIKADVPKLVREYWAVN